MARLLSVFPEPVLDFRLLAFRFPRLSFWPAAGLMFSLGDRESLDPEFGLRVRPPLGTSRAPAETEAGELVRLLLKAGTEREEVLAVVISYLKMCQIDIQ